MNQLLAQYFRLPINVATPAATVADVLSGNVPAVATGAALEFDFIFSNGPLADATICDLSVYSAINFKIEWNGNPHANTPFVAQSIPAANFMACTTAQWQAGTNEHIQVCIPAAQNVLQPGSGSQGQFWLCVYGVLTAAAAAAATPPRAAGDFIPLAYYAINVVDSGIPVANPNLAVSVPIGSKMSFVCADGNTRDVSLVQTPAGGWTFQIGAPYNGPGQAKYSLLCSDALYRDLTVVLAQGFWSVDINQAGHN